MRIIHIDTGREFRGGQRQVFILHSGLIEKNIDSYLICNSQGVLFRKGKENNVKNVIGCEFNNNFFCKALFKKLSLLKPDIVHCHDSKSLNYFIFKKKSFKLIETRRVSYPIKFFSRMFKYSKCDYHVAVSETIEEYLRRFFKNVITIHSCIEPERFKKVFEENPLRGNFEKNILFVGALTKQKGADILIKAFYILSREFPNIGLHIVGSGKDIKKINFIIDYLKIKNRVFLYGYQDEIEKFYQFSDIVVIPSVDGEGSSGVIKEALASGKITVVSNLEENKILIRDGENGFIFENRNFERLYGVLRKIILGKLKLSKESIINSIKDFYCEKMIENYLKLYNRLA